jgi:hypothetical protein
MGIIVLRTKSILVVLILLFVVANELVSWPILKLWNIYANRGFIDLQSPLHHIECFVQGQNFQVLRSNVYPCGGYWYGSTLIYLGEILHLSTHSKYLIAAAISIPLIYFLVSYGQRLYIKADLLGRILLLAAMFSPPSILLFQRGNLDGLIILMLLVAIKLFEGSQKSVLAGWLLILLATLFKFWSIPALFVSILWIRNLFFKVTAFISALIVAFVVYKEYRSVDFGDAFPTAENIFGWRFFSLTLNSTKSYSINPLSSLTLDFVMLFLILICCSLLIKQLSEYELLSDLKSSLDSDKEVWILGSSFVFCYFASSNVDYRLTPLLILALSMTAKIEDLQVSNLILLLISTTMWLTYPSGKLQIFGDVFAALFACLLLVYFLSQTKVIIRKRFCLE